MPGLPPSHARHPGTFPSNVCQGKEEATSSSHVVRTGMRVKVATRCFFFFFCSSHHEKAVTQIVHAAADHQLSISVFFSQRTTLLSPLKYILLNKSRGRLRRQNRISQAWRVLDLRNSLRAGEQHQLCVYVRVLEYK